MNKKNGDKPVVRCAIYTRKSTDEGLDQAFNSLDAQREAAEAYITSQKGEGWVCLPDRYDDGGYTGGNMDRPALQRLLADIEAGRIDCVAVYKVDRISRSLLDFARMMEVFERHHVSFVSITQHFNTATSMGRLILNVLLSFAQFEREIISERTRDKIAATRRKGKWSGGMPVLGYDVVGPPGSSKLVVNEDEAARVRAIFELYLDHQSLIETVKELDVRRWTTKRWSTRKGHERGGLPFNKNRLFRMLTNVVYLGKITYKEEVHEGEHAAIVDADIFDRAQRLLKRNGATGGKHVRNRFGALLKGILRCAPCGCGMVHTHTTRNGNKRYRYYVCQNAQSRGWQSCPSPSVPAREIERFVVEQVKCIGQDTDLLAETLEQCRHQREESIKALESERLALERELRRLDSQLRQLAAKAGQNGVAADRMADIQDRIRVAEQRATEVRDQIIRMGRELVDGREVAQACSLFEPVWDTLASREQARILHLLIQRVDYDGVKGNISITFHPTGIKTLADELSEEAIA
ncbi:MAG: recombinase family protein [Planctomycetes bacterium]|nr:recombinase family protein [Planctomycetota bacterium]